MESYQDVLKLTPTFKNMFSYFVPILKHIFFPKIFGGYLLSLEAGFFF
jgi:hypothetical protein